MDPMTALPEMLLKMAKAGWEGYFHLHRRWTETMGDPEKPSEKDLFEHKGQELFKAWMEIYEKEVRQFLTMPQLGLTRYYQERMGEVLDKFNLFQAKMGEFVYFLSQPLEKSFKVLQGKLEALQREGKLSEDPKDYYQTWIKILEGYYMTLFKSEEYVQAMKNTLETMGEFDVARQRFLEGFLQVSSIPSYKEIDELSREVYELKKRVKVLEKRRGDRPLVLPDSVLS